MAAELPETFEAKQAHQRSSLKWILSKAFNNQVPDNLKDPFYRDHEGIDHIKPQIVVGLGNASLYCQTLSNLYSDPNYQSLNHWSILQTMTRKGISIAETADVQLTETALIQTNPLRIHSHMLVIDALMVLYAKEVATADRVATAVARISGGQLQRDKFHFESGLLVWISHACAALKRRINAELEDDVDGSQFNRLQSPNMPPIREYRDLCDGVCLAFLISYYCPRIVPWSNVRVNHLPTVEDSIHNVLLVSNFSQKHLPYTVFHMTPSDITYMRGAMKQNLVALLADLFNLFEIHPTKCVNYPGMEQQVAVNRSSSASSMRRITPPTSAHIQHQQQQPQYHQSPSQQYHDSAEPGFDEGFVVHRGRAIPTLTSAMHEPLQPARLRQTKEKSNTDSKADERGDHMQTAGRPSNWEDARRPSYAGRRSRRNSFTEDSQLTIENFGGSQDQINMIGRSVELERKYSNSTLSHVTEPTVALRSSVADARGTLQLGYNEPDSGGSGGDSEKQDRETEKKSLRRQASLDNVSLSQLKHSSEEATAATVIASTSAAAALDDGEQLQPQQMQARKKTSFSALPNTTTWQQQQLIYQQTDNNVDDDEPLVDMSKLSGIRMKLEEKRRHIELEKRRLEIQFSKQQQKVGKAAFLQAINKGNRVRNQSGGTNSNNSTVTSSPDTDATVDRSADPSEHVHSTLDYQTDLKKTPESETSDIEHYQENIALMNSSLQDIQMDINRLSNQQSQMHAQHIQANQLLQAQQIANLISQFGSQRNIPPDHASSSAAAAAAAAMPTRFGGSTPHLPQSHAHHHGGQTAGQAAAAQQHSYNIHDQYSMHHQHQASPPPAALHRNNHYPQQQQQYSSQHDIHHQSMHHHQQQQQQQQLQHHHNSGPYAPQQPYLSNAEHHNQYQTYRVEHHQPPPPQSQPPQHGNHHDEPAQFFLHDNVTAAAPTTHYVDHSPQPVPVARRTWAQQSVGNSTPVAGGNAPMPLDINAWSQNSPKPDQRTWKSSSQYLADSSPQPQYPQQQQQQSGGFMLHHQQPPHSHQNGNSVAAGGSPHIDFHQSSPQVNRSELHRSYNNLSSADSPQHQRVHRQISQMIGTAGSPVGATAAASTSDGGRSPYQVVHNASNGHRLQTPQQQQQQSPKPVPAIDDMAPQSISFIGDADADVVDRVMPPVVSEPLVKQRRSHYMEVPSAVTTSEQHEQEHELDLGRLNITSGKLTYRIPSPTRPSLNLNSFDDPNEEPAANADQKGFYIAFDNAQPKRPKPPLRAKRSPKKGMVDQPDDKPSSTSSGGVENSMHHNQPPSRTHSQYGNNSHDDDHMKSISAKHFNASQQQQQDTAVEQPPLQRRSVSSNHMAAAAASAAGTSGASSAYADPSSSQRHLEDLTNRRLVSQLQPQTHTTHQLDNAGRSKENKLIIDDELQNLDPDSVDEMERKKEKIMLLSLQRRQQQEEAKARKELDAMQRREREQSKQEERERKRDQQQARRAAILEQHKFKKAIEKAEQEGTTIDRNDLLLMKQQLAMATAAAGGAGGGGGGSGGGPPSVAKMRPNRVVRPRPKTIHVESGSVDMGGVSPSGSGLSAARNKKGSNSNLTGVGQLSSNSMRRDYYRGSQDSLAIREPTVERGRTISRISVAKGSNLNFRGRKSNSLMNLCADTDSGLGRATPPRRAPSPGMGPSGRHLPSPSGPGSLPPGFMNKRRIYDDGSSDISSAASSIMDYSGPKLYKQPATKSNRGIILNAVEYCVFPGVVNRDAKMKVLDKIARSEAKHFLVLFRDAGCQFRALYGYWPENESVHKLYGTGPNTVDEFMFDKFFKYNSGGKCFSQVHTKHLTVTIDAFTIHNSLWQGKKVAMPSKRDMTLVI